MQTASSTITKKAPEEPGLNLASDKLPVGNAGFPGTTDAAAATGGVAAIAG